MKTIDFKVSRKGMETPFVVTMDVPDNLQDSDGWAAIASAPDEDVHELALQALVIKCQAGARSRIDAGQEAVQAFVNSYKYGARTGGFSAPTIAGDAAASLGFSDAQLAALRAAGMKIGD